MFPYNTVANLVADLAHPDHPALIIQISPNARLAETRDGSYVDITIFNYLPCVSIDFNVEISSTDFFEDVSCR